MTAFEEFGVIPEIAKAIEDMEWFLPTDIQAESIPAILGGNQHRLFHHRLVQLLDVILSAPPEYRRRCVDGSRDGQR